MKKPVPRRLESISLTELQELWPKSDEGALCARLLQRYGFTLLVESSIGAGCAERAQAEAGATKALAKIVKDFGTLALDKPIPVSRKPLAQLKRFAVPAQPEKRQ